MENNYRRSTDDARIIPDVSANMFPSNDESNQTTRLSRTVRQTVIEPEVSKTHSAYPQSVASGEATGGVAGFEYSELSGKTKMMEVLTPTLKEAGSLLENWGNKLADLGNTIAGVGSTYVSRSSVVTTFKPVQYEAVNMISVVNQLIKLWTNHACPGLGCLRDGSIFYWTGLYMDQSTGMLTVDLVGVDGQPRSLELTQSIEGMVEQDADGTLITIEDHSYVFGTIEQIIE